jgi:hypothetical protein
MYKDDEFELAHSIECSSGYAIKLYVRRPEEIKELIANLSNERVGHELSSKEKASTVFYGIGNEVMERMRRQAAELDPKTEERKQNTRKEFELAFYSAGFDIIYMMEIPNEYHGEDSIENMYDPWYLVTTRIGHIKVGWRKRVIVLDWERTILNNTEDLFPDENVTQVPKAIHAWGYVKLDEYLKKLKEEGNVYL